MAKKLETNKSTNSNGNMYDTSDRYENAHNTIVKETITYDNTPIFNKILVCLYVIIALLALNIIIAAIKGSNNNSISSNTDNSTTTTSSNYDVSSFKAINTDEFIKAYNGDETKLIYLGRPDCGYCIKFVPVLTEVQKSYNFQTLYLDINNVGTEDVNRIIALNEDFFKGEDTAYGYTPMTLIVKNGEIVDYQIGYSAASTLETLVSKYFDKK